MSRDFELGPNLSGLSKIAYLFIASGNLGMFERQMGVASVGVNAGAVDGFSRVNARPQTVGRTKKLFRNVTCLFRCCLMSVSMVF